MTRKTVEISLKDFLTKKVREAPQFSPERIMEMAVEQVNEHRPLVIMTNSYEFIVSWESIQDFIEESSAPEPEAAAATLERDQFSATNKPAEPELPGEK